MNTTERTTAAEIIVLRHLNAGIYKSSGGGQTRVISRHASGPRGFRNAIISHSNDCRDAANAYGNIGAGSGWIEVVPKGGEPGTGITISDTPLMWIQKPPAGATLEWWRTAMRSANAEANT